MKINYKIRYLLILLLLISYTKVSAQLDFIAVQTDIDPYSVRGLAYNPIDSLVYMAGMMNYGNPPSDTNIAYYKEGKIYGISDDSLGISLPQWGWTATTLFYHKGRFYASGFQGLMYMNSDQEWKEIIISDKDDYGGGLVKSFCALGGDSLLIGGRFDSIGGPIRDAWHSMMDKITCPIQISKS